MHLKDEEYNKRKEIPQLLEEMDESKIFQGDRI